MSLGSPASSAISKIEFLEAPVRLGPAVWALKKIPLARTVSSCWSGASHPEGWSHCCLSQQPPPRSPQDAIFRFLHPNSPIVYFPSDTNRPNFKILCRIPLSWGAGMSVVTICTIICLRWRLTGVAAPETRHTWQPTFQEVR